MKLFVKRKSAALEILKLYDCDEQLLSMLAESKESQSLEELQIVKFNQVKEGAAELLAIGKLKCVERLNLCSTWFPLNLIKAEAEAEAEVDVTGTRDFERIIWLLKGSLTHL